MYVQFLTYVVCKCVLPDSYLTLSLPYLILTRSLPYLILALPYPYLIVTYLMVTFA